MKKIKNSGLSSVIGIVFFSLVFVVGGLIVTHEVSIIADIEKKLLLLKYQK